MIKKLVLIALLGMVTISSAKTKTVNVNFPAAKSKEGALNKGANEGLLFTIVHIISII